MKEAAVQQFSLPTLSSLRLSSVDIKCVNEIWRVESTVEEVPVQFHCHAIDDQSNAKIGENSGSPKEIEFTLSWMNLTKSYIMHSTDLSYKLSSYRTTFLSILVTKRYSEARLGKWDYSNS